jgi:hypothetical protein
MEIQILGDGSPVYWDLQPYQYHGSIYGVVPARRGVLKLVGEWNAEEVTVQGRRVTVVVNGVTVVDDDLDEASAGGTMDHRGPPVPASRGARSWSSGTSGSGSCGRAPGGWGRVAHRFPERAPRPEAATG